MVGADHRSCSRGAIDVSPARRSHPSYPSLDILDYLAQPSTTGTASHDDELVPAFRHALALALDAGDPSLGRG
ncbi:hypothetical protein ACMHYB_41055 [Sorangium sp. So ce1128]